jgi:glycosyltransferase involved in cell wall biosynthesis
MRILLAHAFYRIAGGEDRYVVDQFNLLRDYHDVELLGRRNGELERGFRAAAQMTWSRRSTKEIMIELAAFCPDVVHLHNTYPSFGPSVHLAVARYGIPLVMTVHNLRLRCPNGLQFTQGAPCRRCEAGAYVNAVFHGCFSTWNQSTAYAASLWIHRFVLRLQEKITMFLVPSLFLRRRLLDWGVSEQQIALVRNFTAFTPNTSPEVGEEGLYLGRLSAEKGLPELLEALRQAGDPPFRIAGEGPLERMLRERANDLGLQRVRFLGGIEHAHVARLLAESRYLVVPSVCSENAPLAALEAMAAGIPLLVSRSGGLPELVSEGSGVTCEPGDVPSLAANLNRLAADDELCRSMGARAVQFASQELSPERHLNRLEEAYRAAETRVLDARDWSH